MDLIAFLVRYHVRQQNQAFLIMYVFKIFSCDVYVLVVILLIVIVSGGERGGIMIRVFELAFAVSLVPCQSNTA